MANADSPVAIHKQYGIGAVVAVVSLGGVPWLGEDDAPWPAAAGGGGGGTSPAALYVVLRHLVHARDIEQRYLSGVPPAAPTAASAAAAAAAAPTAAWAAAAAAAAAAGPAAPDAAAADALDGAFSVAARALYEALLVRRELVGFGAAGAGAGAASAGAGAGAASASPAAAAAAAAAPTAAGSALALDDGRVSANEAPSNFIMVPVGAVIRRELVVSGWGLRADARWRLRENGGLRGQHEPLDAGFATRAFDDRIVGAFDDIVEAEEPDAGGDDGDDGGDADAEEVNDAGDGDDEEADDDSDGGGDGDRGAAWMPSTRRGGGRRRGGDRRGGGGAYDSTDSEEEGSDDNDDDGGTGASRDSKRGRGK
jgi:hypothetical protein